MSPEFDFSSSGFDYQKSIRDTLTSWLASQKAREVETIIYPAEDRAMEVYLVRGEPLVVVISGYNHIWGPPRVSKLIVGKQLAERLNSVVKVQTKTEAGVSQS